MRKPKREWFIRFLPDPQLLREWRKLQQVSLNESNH